MTERQRKDRERQSEAERDRERESEAVYTGWSRHGMMLLKPEETQPERLDADVARKAIIQGRLWRINAAFAVPVSSVALWRVRSRCRMEFPKCWPRPAPAVVFAMPCAPHQRMRF